MTTLVSPPPSASTESRGLRHRWLGRIARGVAVVAAVSASATVVGATPAHAAPVLLMTQNIDGKAYSFYKVEKVSQYNQLFRVCSPSIDGPGAETCLDYRATFNTSSEEGVLTALDSGTLHGRRLMTGEQQHAYVRLVSQPAYYPPALPAGATLLEPVINLHNADLGFQRFRRADGHNIVRMWAPRSAGMINGAPRVEVIDVTLASDVSRDRVSTFMQQVREAERQRLNITNVTAASRYWVGLVGAGAAVQAFRYGSQSVGGTLMTLAALAFFLAPRFDAPMAMNNAMRAAEDAFTLMWGYDPVFDWEQNVR